jgi:hypothetical protein
LISFLKAVLKFNPKKVVVVDINDNKESYKKFKAYFCSFFWKQFF